MSQITLVLLLAAVSIQQIAAQSLLCSIPGCTSCPLLGLGRVCNACGAGYQLIGSRCGCAVGYGSYTSPAVSGYPSAAPSCLLAAATDEGGAVTAAATADAAPEGAPGTGVAAAAGVQPAFLLGNKCSCFLCPPGYSSVGGTISQAACVPVVTLPSQSCAGQPPRAANARPWAQACRNGTVGRTCRAACNAGFNGGPVVVECTASRGWQVRSGQCTSPAAGACAGRPLPATGRVWPATCTGAATNYLCRGSQPCPSGQGSAAALSVCLPSGYWSQPEIGLCPGVSDKTCSGPPQDAANNQWIGCSNQPAGFICIGQCQTGFTGQLLSQCNANGTYELASGSACAPVRCAGLPPIGSNGATYPSSCSNAQYNYACVTGCAPGFSGQYSSICQTTGLWAPPVGSCTASSGSAATSSSARCAGPPPAVPGVSWGLACPNSPSQFVCTGSCANGGGTYTSTCSGGAWSTPQGSCTPGG